MRTNKQWIDIARVEVREASVSRLPFSEGAFDGITAVETHFWCLLCPRILSGYHHQSLKSFVRTKTADEILASRAILCAD
jgi:hypothetical protein